jgi:multidrug efflux pump subunit AcrA (membrane-fusion protein)
MMRLVLRVALCAFAVSACPSLARMSIAATEGPAVVFVDIVKPKRLFESLTYPARVVPKLNTTILAETDGIVSRIYAPLGQRVARKQRVLAITHTDPVYQYAPVLMLAPVAGVVSAIEVTEGSQVTRGQKLGSVTDPSQVRVVVEVPAQDLAFMSKGMPGSLKLSGRDEPIALRVRGVSPFVDPATGTASCELELVKPREAALAPGVLGKATFEANARDGISIPDHAVVYRGTDTFVRVIEKDGDKGGKAKQVAVKLGRKERGNVEILSGLTPGAQLVMRASKYVADGDAVKVESAAQSEEAGAKQ